MRGPASAGLCASWMQRSTFALSQARTSHAAGKRPGSSSGRSGETGHACSGGTLRFSRGVGSSAAIASSLTSRASRSGASRSCSSASTTHVYPPPGGAQTRDIRLRFPTTFPGEHRHSWRTQSCGDRSSRLGRRPRRVGGLPVTLELSSQTPQVFVRHVLQILLVGLESGDLPPVRSRSPSLLLLF